MKILNLIFMSDFDNSYAMFNDEVKAMMDYEQFVTAMARMSSQLGNPQNVGKPEIEAGENETVIIVPLEYEMMKLNARIIVTSDNLISTFLFQPIMPKVDWVAPPYVDNTKFSERRMTVVTGEFEMPAILTMPIGKENIPAIVLVHGSGPNDMDETVMGTKVFKDLAWGLASKGIAVLRYDKRTLTHGGKINLNQLTLKEETIDDALSAANLLMTVDEINKNQIYILGHSLGGMAMPRIAKDFPKGAGFIILAGSVRNLAHIIADQYEYILSDANENPESQKLIDEVKMQVDYLMSDEFSLDSPSDKLPLSIPALWWHDHLNSNTEQLVRDEKRPVYIIHAERDYQVTMKDYRLWEELVKDLNNYTLKLYPKLNHLLVEGEGKSTPDEYKKSGNVSKEIIDDIYNWINK